MDLSIGLIFIYAPLVALLMQINQESKLDIMTILMQAAVFIMLTTFLWVRTKFARANRQLTTTMYCSAEKEMVSLALVVHITSGFPANNFL